MSHSVETKKKISLNNAKYWLGKKRTELAKKRLGSNNPMFGRKISEETRLKMKEAHRLRLKNHVYTDPTKTRTAYVDVHKWISRVAGKPKFCNHCLTKEDRMYHWANISKNYYRDVSDWVRLCVPCHKKYDLERVK